jgi:hypothetical protein
VGFSPGYGKGLSAEPLGAIARPQARSIVSLSLSEILKLKPPGKLLPLDADANAVHSRPADRGKLFCRGSSPLLCAPALRPARLLGYLAPPRSSWLLAASAACFGAPLARDHLSSPVYPSCMHWCWCRACSGHLLLGTPTQRVKRTSCSDATAVAMVAHEK